jgi:hypothetical protein
VSAFKSIPRDSLRVFPLEQRRSLTRIEEILVDPETAPAPVTDANKTLLTACVKRIRGAREQGAAVMLIYGAHLLRNGAALILDQLMSRGWITHVATNGAGTIHDWEYAWLGRSTESVEQNVVTGTFGAWDETGRNIHLALLAGGLHDEGYGEALGRFIDEDGTGLPDMETLSNQIASDPANPFTPARADLLQSMLRHKLEPGRHQVVHRWKQASILASAFRHKVPMTVHPGIGYDIMSNHPMFNGAAIGRAAETDFRIFGGSVDQLDNGVVLSVGSAIMGPQVFEKSLSCVNNIRLQQDRPVVSGHSIFVVDLQDGGNWDWTKGEPPKTNPAYYLRFCKSYSRMGGEMHYAQSDNLAFIHHLHHQLVQS